MGKNYSALYMSLALHVCAYLIVIFSLPSALKDPPLPVKIPSISIEFVRLAAEAPLPARAHDKSEPERINPVVPLAVSGVIPIKILQEDKLDEQLDETVASEPLDALIESKLGLEFDNTYLTLANGKVVSLADWVIGGLDKSKTGSDAPKFESNHALEQIARALSAYTPSEDLNPLLGDGELPLGPLDITTLKVKSVNGDMLTSLISRRHMRRKEGAYTGGIYGSVAPGDINASGTGIIAYEANISNCAHEEARTGVNRCRAFERWVSQKVYEVIKAQEKK